jgi:hypothetical protein
VDVGAAEPDVNAMLFLRLSRMRPVSGGRAFSALEELYAVCFCTSYGQTIIVLNGNVVIQVNMTKRFQRHLFIRLVHCGSIAVFDYIKSDQFRYFGDSLQSS